MRTTLKAWVFSTKPLSILSETTLSYSDKKTEEKLDFFRKFRTLAMTRYEYLDGHYSLSALKQHQERQAAEFPCHDIVLLVGDRNEYEELSRLQIRVAFVHHNAFIDERIFRILPVDSKQFDTVYLGNLLPYKRHFLAKNLRNHSIVAGQWPEQKGLVSRADVLSPFTHPVSVNDRDLNAHEVCAWLNNCKVGLVLSAAEGGCRAVTEYQYCGLPVVSTHSKGGRDEFLFPFSSRICEPDPDIIEKAVLELLQGPPDSQSIRQSTLERAELHRKRFSQLLDEKAPGLSLLFWNRFRSQTDRSVLSSVPFEKLERAFLTASTVTL